MDRWLDRDGHPATRAELHYGARMIRCFVERPRSVHAMLAHAVARRAHGLALICGEERLSYAELDALVGEAAGGLRALGVGKGDRVAMVLGNSIEFVVVLFALGRLARCRFRSTSATRWPRTAISSRIARRSWSSTNSTSRTAFRRQAPRQV